MQVHPTEKELLLRLRTRYRFGEVLIEMKDGLPFRMAKTVVYEKLSEPSYPQEELSV